MTAVFSPAQALVAGEAGARYVAVSVNRATRQMGNGLQLVEDIAKILKDSETEILAASINLPMRLIRPFLLEHST